MASEHDIEALLVHDRFVRGLARGLVRDAAAAEDLAQDAWLAALRSGARLASFPRWAGAALRNLARNAHRADARRGAREAAAARPEGVPSADEVLAREALRTELVALVLALEEPLRGTVLLRFFDGLAPREIARREGVPIETVRTRLKRGLAKLRERLERERGGAWAALVLPLARGCPRAWSERVVDTASTLTPLAVMTTQAKLAAIVVAVIGVVLAVEVRRGGGSDAGAEPRSAEGAALRAPEPDEGVGLALEAEPAAAERAELPAAPPGAETAAAEERGSALVRVRWHDGAPAEWIGVRVQDRWTSSAASVRDREGRTDALGELRVDGLAPGAAYVRLDRGDSDVDDEVEIAAGRESTLELVLSRGYDLAGVVLDPLGAPVAGAEVVYAPSSAEDSSVVARSDAAGRFHVRALGETGAQVWARSRGFEPSLCTQVGASEGVTLALELVLLGAGGAIAGTVVDPEGAPVAGAWVLAGLDRVSGVVERVPAGGTRSVMGTGAGPSIVRTDAVGRYLVEGLAPGTRRVAVRAMGFGAARAEVEVVADVMRVHDWRLAPGVSVAGRITKADGSAASRASIEVGEGDGVLRSEADVDADGRYRLEDLEAGALELRVTSRRDGDARVELQGAPGETLACDVRLVPGASIRGRLLDERGGPLAGWRVHAADDPVVAGDHDWMSGESDEAGRFVLEDLHERTHRVEVSHPEHGKLPVLEMNGVRPGGEELVLIVEDVLWPSVRVRGRIVDELGAPLPEAQVAIGRDAASVMRGVRVEEDGQFEVGLIPPGAWAVRVHGQGFGPARVVLGPRVLAAGEVWECGDVRVVRKP